MTAPTAAPAALAGDLGFATAEASLNKMLEQLPAEGGAQTVDLSGVTRADSAGLALLLELTRAAQARGGLQFANAPAQLRKLAEFFGLSDLLAFR